MPRPVSNPPNPWASEHVEWLEEPPIARLEVFEEEAKSIVARNDSPDVGFEFSINPYRGCFHGCAYCYARPRHQLLGFGAGTDFERKIVVKTNAPELLRRELMRPSWKGDLIAFSGDTDCYQPLEAAYALTRRCLEVCLEFQNPVGLITKGVLIRRDVDVLVALGERARASVCFSIPFADDETSRLMEPSVSPTSKRFEAMRVLSDAGIRTSINIAPLIPGLNDEDVPDLLRRAKDAGARGAGLVLLRLPDEVHDVFDERVREAFPDRADKIWNGIREVRGGKDYDARFFERQRGHGVRWDATRKLFDLTCKRLGLNGGGEGPAPQETTFRRPTRQLGLFS